VTHLKSLVFVIERVGRTSAELFSFTYLEILNFNDIIFYTCLDRVSTADTSLPLFW